MINTQKIFQDSLLWVRIAICANTHIKKALLRVLHNDMKNHQVTGVPSDPKDLYMFLKTKQKKIQNAKHLKKDQKLILLPTSSQSVNSSLLDISLIRWLIQTFCNITNASGNWQEPLQTDQTICANVYRAANMRNRIFHYDDVETLDEPTFETMWKEMKNILKGLNYTEDIEPMRTETLDITKIQGEILQEFRDHLEDYKKEISKEAIEEFYIQRSFSVDQDPNSIVTEIDKLIKESDQVHISANAGVGKSVTARNIKYEWSKDKILNNYFVLYFDSKKINQQIRYHSFAAPLFFSELGHYLKKKGKTDQNFKYFDCVKTTIENLIIIIDGIDEFPIKDLVIGNYVNELENKVKNNDEISASDTIIAIYFGFLFPYSKICLLGRIGEFEQLKKFKSPHSTIFNGKNRIIKELELLEFDEANVKNFTCLKICKQQNGHVACSSACQDIYVKVKDIEVCKIPTDLNSLIELHKKYPNKNIGKITRTKLIIATLLNRLNEHIYQKNFFTFKTFREIREREDFSKYLNCICILCEMSFKTILENYVTVQVEEERDTNNIVYFNYNNQIKIERTTLEELDLFYIRDFDYYFILEPYHTLNIEFLSACYLFLHQEEWDSLLELRQDRQLAIISFIAGLYAIDYFTKDFVTIVLKVSNYSLETFFSWMYNVENVRDSLAYGGESYYCWYGLMENQKLSPSFFLLDFISHEVEIPQSFIPKTILYHHYRGPSLFEWYNMKIFKHSFLTNLFNEVNIESFLIKFSSFNFIIKDNIEISNNNEFNQLNNCVGHNLISFKLNVLCIKTSLDSYFRSNLDLNSLEIGEDCDSRTIDMILNAISPSTNIPKINCKRLCIDCITHYNAQQTEKLFNIGLSGNIDFISLGSSRFFRYEQIEILKKVERKTNKIMNIELNNAKFNCVFELPNLGCRHISLCNINKVTNDDVIQLKARISPGYSNNLLKYKIIFPYKPFVRKTNHSQACDQSMYLHLSYVDFTKVSPDVFANTFSLIPSFACFDYDRCVPSSHWLSLSKKDDCHINEMRVLLPKSKNFEHFLNIKTNILQFICYHKYEMIKLLNHIMDNQNVQLEREIKIFVVKFDENDWDYYEEIVLLSGKTVAAYKDNYNADNSLLDDIPMPFHEGEKHLKYWCCEISSPLKKNTVRSVNSSSCGDESTNEEAEVVIDELKNEDNRNESQEDCNILKKCFCCL